MSKFKRTLALALALTMALALFAACGGGTSGSQPAGSQATGSQPAAEGGDELYVIDYLYRWGEPNVEMSGDTEIGAVIKEKFGIEFRWIPYGGDYTEKLNLMLAGGDYPEILEIQGNTELLKYINAGALMCVDDYIDQMPDFAARFENELPILRSVAPDKKLYNWQYNQSDLYGNLNVFDVSVRIDALEAQGWPNLLSTDDYIAFLKQAMIDFPTTEDGQPTIGMAAGFAEPWGTAGTLPCMYEKGGRYDGIAGNGPVIFSYEEDAFTDYFQNEYVKESYQFFNRLNQAGVLDPECFTDLDPQVTEKMNTGRALSVWYTRPNYAQNRIAEEEGREGAQYITMPIRSMTQIERDEKRLILELDIVNFSNVVMTKNAKQPERIMELINWAASEEGQLLIQAGIEGKHYTIEDGIRVPTELCISERQNAKNTVGWGNFSYLCNDLRVSKVDGLPYDPLANWDIRDEVSLTDGMKNAFEQLGWDSSVEYWRETSEGAPAGVISSVIIDPASELGMLSEKMVDFRVKNTSNLVLAASDAEFEALYAQLMTEYEALEPGRVVDEYNRLYQELQTEIYG